MRIRLRTQQLGNRLALIPRTLRLVWAATGRWSVVWLTLLISQGLIPAGLVYWTRYLVDALAAGQRGSTWASVQQMLLPALLMGDCC